MTDQTDFNFVAMSLRHPDSPIQYILHVKDRALLAEVAAQIDLDYRSGRSAPQGLSPALLTLIRAGAMKVSARQGQEDLDPGAVIDAARILPSAITEGIFLPPFHLAYTPGLFEGKVIENTPPAKDERRRSAVVTPDGLGGGGATGNLRAVRNPESGAEGLEAAYGVALEYIKYLKSKADSGTQ